MPSDSNVFLFAQFLQVQFFDARRLNRFISAHILGHVVFPLTPWWRKEEAARFCLQTRPYTVGASEGASDLRLPILRRLSACRTDADGRGRLLHSLASLPPSLPPSVIYRQFLQPNSPPLAKKPPAAAATESLFGRIGLDGNRLAAAFRE